MATIHELGSALRARRTEMGLTQDQVALMSGLSRQTISQVETGAVPDLGLNKAEKLAAVVGLALRIEPSRRNSVAPKLSPLKRAARSAGVSYKTALSSTLLKNILVRGKVPKDYEPHLHALLDDAPLSLLAAVVDQVHEEAHIARDAVWRSYRELAAQVRSRRDIWK